MSLAIAVLEAEAEAVVLGKLILAVGDNEADCTSKDVGELCLFSIRIGSDAIVAGTASDRK